MTKTKTKEKSAEQIAMELRQMALLMTSLADLLEGKDKEKA